MSLKKIAGPVSVVLVASGLAALGVPAPARADVTTSQAAAALDLPAGVTVSGFSGPATSRAVADTTVDQNAAFNDFPSQGTSYLLLSTGNADDVFEGVPTSQLSTDFGNDNAPDTASMTLSVAQGTAGCLFVDFAMGTEENTTYAESVPDDELSVLSNGNEYAVNAGSAYFTQDDDDADSDPDWPEASDRGKSYHVHQIDYWHKPGDPLDPVPGTAETPRLAAVTGLNYVTTRDTARVPLDTTAGAQSIQISIADAPGAANGDLDSVAFVDRVRLGSSCSGGTGVEPNPANQESPNACCGVIRGIRGVGNALYYDPVPSTEAVEMYDDSDNGWRSPSNTPVELRFRWYRTTLPFRNDGRMWLWDAIPHADRQSYVPTSVDRGKHLIVLVTGVVDGRRVETFPSTNSASTWYVTTSIDYGTFTSDATLAISTPTGALQVGDTVTAQIGNMIPRQDTYNWQWFARFPGGSWQPVSGATGQNFQLGEAEAGKEITVRATAERDQFDSKTVLATNVVGPVQYLPWTATPNPSIVHDGTPETGDELSVNVGMWAPTPTGYSYQWRRNGNVIPGASQATYELVSADVGDQITVTVSGVRTGYAPSLRTSSAIVAAGETMLGAPIIISGELRVGQRLTASADGWSPSGSSLRFAWYADDSLLQTGTNRTLMIPVGAVGKRITVRVTGTRSGYTPLTVSSDPTAVVPKGTITTYVPRILGGARVGETLTVATGYWSPKGVRLTYQWKVGSRAVKGAAGKRASFTIPRTARGKRITVTVTGTLANYKTAKKTSQPTSPVGR